MSNFTWKVSDVGLFFKIPDFNLRVLSTRPKNEAVWVELSRRERCSVSISYFSQKPANPNVRECPMLIQGR